MPSVAAMDETLAARVFRLRDAKGWTQEELAGRAGITKFAVRQIEQGVTENPRLDTLRAIARALGVSLDELAGE